MIRCRKITILRSIPASFYAAARWHMQDLTVQLFETAKQLHATKARQSYSSCQRSGQWRAGTAAVSSQMQGIGLCTLCGPPSVLAWFVLLLPLVTCSVNIHRRAQDLCFSTPSNRPRSVDLLPTSKRTTISTPHPAPLTCSLSASTRVTSCALKPRASQMSGKLPQPAVDPPHSLQEARDMTGWREGDCFVFGYGALLASSVWKVSSRLHTWPLLHAHPRTLWSLHPRTNLGNHAHLHSSVCVNSHGYSIQQRRGIDESLSGRRKVLCAVAAHHGVFLSAFSSSPHECSVHSKLRVCLHLATANKRTRAWSCSSYDIKHIHIRRIEVQCQGRLCIC